MTDQHPASRHPGLDHIVAVMDRLRSPGGCAWDAVQTHQSLAEYLVEETYELLEAIDTGDRVHLREELGDVLLQVVFHCRIAQDDPTDPFDIDEVAEGIAAKLIRRHPQVFGDAPAEGATLSNWERVKAQEKGRTSPLDGVPPSLPPLTAIGKIRYRADVAEVAHAVAPPEPTGRDAAEDFGDDLLRQVLQAAEAGIDAEAALRGAVRRARERVALALEAPVPDAPVLDAPDLAALALEAPVLEAPELAAGPGAGTLGSGPGADTLGSGTGAGTLGAEDES